MTSSEDEVTTPLKTVKRKESGSMENEESSLKRSLLNEFSTTMQEKKLKEVIIKKEKE